MRYLVIATVLSILVLSGMSDSARAVGYDVAGKEECVCSPLVARGIYPDTLNNLKEALVLPKLGFLAERLAQEIKAILGQFGVQSAGDPRGRVEPAKSVASLEIRAEGEKKRLADAKTKKKTREKKKRVKLPPRAR
jgi:hypothetical protein